MSDWLAKADPSWYARVLGVLQRDCPQMADKVWSTAISENAADLRLRAVPDRLAAVAALERGDEIKTSSEEKPA